MKKSFLYILAASALLTGCLKDTPNTDFSNVEPLAEISSSSLNSNLGAPSSGLDYFKQATLPSFTSDDPFVVTFNVNITGEYPPNKDITVTLAVDDNLRTSYNNGPKTQSVGVPFEAMPDSVYTFATKSATIKSGSRLAQFTVTFDPTKYDVTRNYMLPIKITDASGTKISGNLGSIYIHNLGNPIAGAYTHEWIRWNNADGSGTPDFDQTYDDVLAAASPTQVTLTSNTGTVYIVNFTNGNPPGGKDLSLLTDFKVKFDAASTDGITITDGPSIVADPVNHTYTFKFSYLNGSGAPRVIIDKIWK